MPKISIRNFSCIVNAEFELKPVNVIIGPQGSGKSVTTKVFYFLNEILRDFLRFAEDGVSLSDYQKLIEKQFCSWFPPSAWGGDRFNILFVAEPFSARVLRRVGKGKMGDEVAVKFSSWFESTYNGALAAFEKDMKSANRTEELDDSFTLTNLERSWRVRQSIQRKIQRELEGAYIANQIFIPAGRAFFTSIGKMVAGLENASNLDPLTLRFARLLASWRDSPTGLFARNSTNGEYSEKRSAFMAEMFGGKIVRKNDVEIVEASDGRKIPFGSLSSGQQELVPIWYYLDNLLSSDQAASRRKSPNTERPFGSLVYIEEPEAHLFPSAQSNLMNYLVSTVVRPQVDRSLILTTHSPYIMSKLNVFLKAGQLSKRRKKNTEIDAVIPRDCWLQPDQISAWAISQGKLIDIIDQEDGLIDGRYLDQISEQNANEYSALLEIEDSI